MASFFGIYFTSGQCLHGLYYIRLCFFTLFVFGLNVIDQILCLLCWNFKIFHKLTDPSPKWRHLWYLFYVRSMPLRLVLHPLVFFQFLMYGLNVIDQILCLFCWNYKNFSKLTNTSPKCRHLWNFICLRSMPLRFVLHPFLFFFSSLFMAWMLSI